MQKKKSQTKISFPSLPATKPNETTKSYASKANLSKNRDIEDKNLYFQMPSIHQNDLSLKTFIDYEQKGLKKTQLKVLKLYESLKENRMAEEWDLYIKKSEIANSRSLEFYELEQFLVKIIHKLSVKLSENQLLSGFSFAKNISNASQIRQSMPATSFADNSKNLVLLDRTLNQKQIKTVKAINKGSAQQKMVSGINQSLIVDASVSLLTQQNVVLDKKVQLYQKRIIQLQSVLSKFQEKQKDPANEQDTTNQIMTLTILKNKYKYDSEVKTMQIDTLTEELALEKSLTKNYKIKLDELEVVCSQCKEENKVFRQYLKYKELWLMSTEETYSWRAIFQQQKEENNRLQNKIKMLKDKNKQLLNYFNMSNVVNPDQEQDKQDLDKIIKEFKEWLMIISVPKVSYNGQEANQQEENKKKELNPNDKEINIKLLRPNFYIFFEAYENTLLMEKNIINIRPIEYNFFLKIRVIFDSMFNAFQIATSYKEYPSFPEFVIGFLEKYHLNPATNLLQYRKKPIESQEKITFLVNLFNKNFCNTWQCDIFKNFLFEQYTLDEIYFFLDCRNQLNNGIATTHILGAADPISYVKLSKALKVVGKKLYPYENYIVERVKNILKSKKSIKYGESFIDKNFVLKILLQVYVLQRAKSERIFQSSFKSKMKKSYITFGDFHNFMCKNFTFLSSIQIAAFYRQVYALSSGHVTYKAIHYMCGVKGLFIPLLLSKRVTKNTLEQTLNQDMLLLDIQNSLTKMNVHFEQMGVESFMRLEHSINNFMRQLDWYKDNKAAFYHRLFLEKCHLLKVNMLLFLKSSYQMTPGEILQNSQIQNHMIQVHSMLHRADTQVPFLSKQKERRSKALLMLVRNFKIRIQQSILQFQKVNEEQIKKLRQQIQRSQDPTKLMHELESFSKTMPSQP